MSRSFTLTLPGRLNRCGWVTMMAVGAVASIAAACPEVTSRLPFDGRDGQLSQNVGGAVAGFPLRAADDFLLEIGNGNPWAVREVRAVMLVDWVPTTANFGLQVFNDGFSAPTGPVPGTSACVKLGAASVTDLGITVDTHHAYEVRFALSESECVVLADRWYWVTVHAVAPIPGFGSAFFATGGNGVISGVVARKSDNFPSALWRSVEECCIGTTDLAFSVRSEQTQTFAADINCSGNLSVQDLFDFLAEYFAGSLNSDFNYSGQTSVQDIFDFLACYFGGCV